MLEASELATLEKSTFLGYIRVFPKIGGTPKWMVYNGKPY